MKRLTMEEFTAKAEAIHGDRYDYSSVNYVNTRTKVTVICRVPGHPPFAIKPQDHIQKKGCTYCAKRKKVTNDIFIEDAEKVHGERYDYSQASYKNNKTEVDIICRVPGHPVFSLRPDAHLYQNQGCPVCGGTQRLTTESFIEKAKAIHRDRYDYSLVRYGKDNKDPVIIICRIPDHGSFLQTPNDHLKNDRKVGCPNCADSGFNPSEPGLLYYLAISTDDGDTRYKIGITNLTVEQRFPARDLTRVRIVKTWRYAIGRVAAEREAEIKEQFAGDRYYGPKILKAGNTEIFTHDILGLDKLDRENG